jgi:WD40 repeat protein
MNMSRAFLFALFVNCALGRLAAAEDDVLFKVHGTGTGVALAADGSMLASTDGCGEVRIWNFSEERLVHHIVDAHANGKALVFAPGSGLLATTSGKLVRLWSVTTGQEIGTLRGIRPSFNLLIFLQMETVWRP